MRLARRASVLAIRDASNARRATPSAVHCGQRQGSVLPRSRPQEDGATSWNSLELARLAVAISTPVTVLAAGWWIKQREQINAELIRKRIAIYDEVVPKANDILCFYLAASHCREIDPAKVIECKRDLDGVRGALRPGMGARDIEGNDADARSAGGLRCLGGTLAREIGVPAETGPAGR